jgi:hypothetical protein
MPRVPVEKFLTFSRSIELYKYGTQPKHKYSIGPQHYQTVRNTTERLRSSKHSKSPLISQTIRGAFLIEVGCAKHQFANYTSSVFFAIL